MKKLIMCFLSAAVMLCACGRVEQGNEISSQEETSTLTEQKQYIFYGEVQEIREGSVLADDTWIYTDSLSEYADAIEDIEVGDSIKVEYDGAIAESYPAQMHGAYSIEVIGRVEDKIALKNASYINELIGISLQLPEGWDYTNNSEPENGAELSMDIYPVGETGKISIGYHELFGVCGTGLNSVEAEYNGMKALKGFYDNNNHWAFICFESPYDKYVILSEGTEEWQQKYYDEVEQILNTLEFTNTEQ